MMRRFTDTLLPIAMLILLPPAGEASVVVSTSLSKSQVSPGEALDVHITAHNTDAAQTTLTFSHSEQSGYLIDGIGPTQSWGSTVITNRIIPGNSSYTWTLRNDWRFQPMAIGTRQIIGQVFGYGAAAPLELNVVAPVYPTEDFTIDFDSLPGGGPSPTSITEFWPFGVRFRSESTSMQPIPTLQGALNRYLGINSATNPPGYNIIADFDMPVFGATVDVTGTTGASISLTAKDVLGNVIDSSVSAPLAVGGEFVPLAVSSTTPIASLEWWSSPNNGIRIDNLAITVPEPAAGGLLLLSGALLARPLPRRRGLH